jgi:hypothetical protein
MGNNPTKAEACKQNLSDESAACFHHARGQTFESKFSMEDTMTGGSTTHFALLNSNGTNNKNA